jgi:hypothetical protein
MLNDHCNTFNHDSISGTIASMLDDHNTFISNETLFVPLLNMHKDLSGFFGFFGEVLSEVPNDLQFKALEDWIFDQLNYW